MNNNTKILAAVLVAIVVIGAAWVVWPRSEGTDGDKATVTDLAGRNVAVELPVDKVVLADMESINAFAAVVGPDFLDHIIGGLSNWEASYPDMYEAYIEVYPGVAKIPSVGDLYTGSFSTEAVINLQPDVLILPLWCTQLGDSAPNVDILKEAGIPTVFVDFYTDPYGNNQGKSVDLLGKLFGKEERAAGINAFYETEVNKVFGPLGSIEEDGPTVYVECPSNGADEHGITTKHMGIAMPVDYAGGENIANGLTLGQTGASVTLSYLIDKDPEIILFSMTTYYPDLVGKDMFGFGSLPTDDQLSDMAGQYLERNGWSELTAVKENRVYFYYNNLAFGIENFAALQLMASLFYPEEFGSLDPLGSLEEFYELYMPIEFEGTWFYSIADMSR